jgi:hypothetical protein
MSQPDTAEFFRKNSAMNQEYEAWQNIMKEFKRLDIDMNKPKYNRLIKAICVWGERLHELRSGQTPEQVQKALAMNLNDYESAKRESR